MTKNELIESLRSKLFISVAPTPERIVEWHLEEVSKLVKEFKEHCPHGFVCKVFCYECIPEGK